MLTIRLATLLIADILAAPAVAVMIPHLSGSFGVRYEDNGLTDASQLEPFAFRPEVRSMVVRVYSPVPPSAECHCGPTPIYPSKTAVIFDTELASSGIPKGKAEQVKWYACTRAPRDQISNAQKPAAPLVLSSGLGSSMLWYSGLAQ